MFPDAEFTSLWDQTLCVLDLKLFLETVRLLAATVWKSICYRDRVMHPNSEQYEELPGSEELLCCFSL